MNYDTWKTRSDREDEEHAAKQQTHRMKPTLLRITEHGNGLPSVGENVYDSTTDTLYELVADYSGAVIHTGPPGSGNYCFMYGQAIGDAFSISDEEFDELPEVGVDNCEEESEER